MTPPPPATPGQRSVVETHYERVGQQPVAFIDETYSAQQGQLNFYVMGAVVVSAKDRDGLRSDLDERVESGYWHTTDVLRSDEGQDQALDLLQCLDEVHEACVIIHRTDVDPDDTDGEEARQECLGLLLESLFHATGGTHDPVGLMIMEERRTARQNNNDRRTRAQLIQDKRIDPTAQLLHVSPGTDNLLWLPDLVCSAYRQRLLGRGTALFDEVERLATVTTFAGDTANPRLP